MQQTPPPARKTAAEGDSLAAGARQGRRSGFCSPLPRLPARSRYLSSPQPLGMSRAPLPHPLVCCLPPPATACRFQRPLPTLLLVSSSLVVSPLPFPLPPTPLTHTPYPATHGRPSVSSFPLFPYVFPTSNTLPFPSHLHSPPLPLSSLLAPLRGAQSGRGGKEKKRGGAGHRSQTRGVRTDCRGPRCAQCNNWRARAAAARRIAGIPPSLSPPLLSPLLSSLLLSCLLLSSPLLVFLFWKARGQEKGKKEEGNLARRFRHDGWRLEVDSRVFRIVYRT